MILINILMNGSNLKKFSYRWINNKTPSRPKVGLGLVMMMTAPKRVMSQSSQMEVSVEILWIVPRSAMAAPNSSEYLEDVEHFYDTDIVNLTSLSSKGFKRERERERERKARKVGNVAQPVPQIPQL